MKKFDLQDLLSLVGAVAIVDGLWMWNHAAAVVVFGVLCLTVARRAERERALNGAKNERKS